MEKVIVATKNRGKIDEIKKVLSDLPFHVVSMGEAGIDIEIEENGQTFEENALIKALEICRISGTMSLADDSGLEVDFLHGAPGIYSARFGGPEADDNDRNIKLLGMLEDISFDKRTARFVCAIAVAFPDGQSFVVRDTCEGYIDFQCRGDQGFGYDPLFFIPQLGKTMGELEPDIKNKISHRAKALAQMQEKIHKFLK